MENLNQITLKDVYEVTNRIEDKLDKIAHRVSELELWRANMLGRITIVTFLFSIVFTFAMDWIKTKLAL